jgi:hypothetical protein
LVIAGCGGGSGLAQALTWDGAPRVQGRTVSGTVRNTTSHSVTLDPKEIRFLDPDGRSLHAKGVHVAKPKLAAGETTRLSAGWTGKTTPSRLDYGAGTLSLSSG